jgi:hypothetical protein
MHGLPIHRLVRCHQPSQPTCVCKRRHICKEIWKHQQPVEASSNQSRLVAIQAVWWQSLAYCDKQLSQPVCTTSINIPLSAVNIPLSAANIPLSAANIPLSAVNIPLSAANIPLSAVNIPLSAAKRLLIEERRRQPTLLDGTLPWPAVHFVDRPIV